MGLMNPETVGGQAVIEGVMMKAPKRLCVAVRRPSGDIMLKNDPFRPLSERCKALGWPFLRGPIVLGETLILGMKALTYSAQQALEEEDEQIGPWAMAATMAVALAAGLGLFVALPHLVSMWLGGLDSFGFDVDSLWFHLVDGVIKMVLFVGYIWIISLMRDIRRVFEYHGAEHKSIYCFEAGDRAERGKRPALFPSASQVRHRLFTGGADGVGVFVRGHIAHVSAAVRYQAGEPSFAHRH